MRCHAATACLPGLPFDAAVAEIHAGISEPMLGTLDAGHIQLCPQSAGEITDAACEVLRERYPRSRFRLHANARVWSRLVMLDASTVADTTLPYYAAIGARSRRLGAHAYTLHAGYRKHATLDQMLDAVRRLQDVIGIPVGVEGLYPRPDKPQLMDSWREYERVMRAGVPMAVDLSHLFIVASHEGWQSSLVRELLSRPETIEVHLSANNGARDSHDTLKEAPPWWAMLGWINDAAVVFSEGNQLRRRPRALAALAEAA